MRYLLTTRGRFKKTHMLVGHGNYYVTDCGLRFIRTSAELKKAKKVRVYPTGQRASGGHAIWPSHKELGVTCSRCLEFEGREPFHKPKKKASLPEPALPPSLDPGGSTEWISETTSRAVRRPGCGCIAKPI